MSNNNPRYTRLSCICDNCNKEIGVLEKELAFLTKEKIIISGFVCPCCGTEYITTVTDNQLRNDIYKARELELKVQQINRAMKNEYNIYTDRNKEVPGSIKLKYMDILDKATREYQEQVAKNRKRGKLLKNKYKNYRKV